MTQKLEIQWSSFKTAQTRAGFIVYYATDPLTFNTDGTVNTYEYEVLGSEGDRFYRAFLSSSSDISDFETNYKTNATAVASADDALALIPPSVNSLGAQLVEVTARLYQHRAITIVTHDFSDPTTWYQNSTQVSQETLTDNGGGVFASANGNWVNVEGPKIFADDTLDVVGWAEDGYANINNHYSTWYQPDASQKLRQYYYPVIEIQPGGSGSWQTANPADSSGGSDPNYGYTIDYVSGFVYFNSQTNWIGGTAVRASYFWAAETYVGSTFKIGPPAGKKWLLNRTEVQLSVGASWQDTIILLALAGGIVGGKSQYKTWQNMQSTSTSSGAVMLEGGIATTPQSWPAGPDNGWMHGGADGSRNVTRKIEVDPWVYDRPYVLYSSQSEQLSVGLAAGKKFLEADMANVSFYFSEFSENS